MRKTKIICTLGPASQTEEVIRQMVESGMNVARFNMSHGTHESHHKMIELVKKVRKDMNRPVSIMIDTNGPEIRVGEFENFSVTLNAGDNFIFTTEKRAGNHAGVMVSYPHFPMIIKKGDIIFANDGLIKFEVTKVEGMDVYARVLIGGVLSSRKSLNVPGLILDTPYLTENDKAHLLFGIKEHADMYSLSFVSCKQDVLDIRNFLKEHGDNGALLCSKIESQRGVDNIDEIIEVSDSIMVARGDLGVEVPYERIPDIQKQIITKCIKSGKNVITATEMLESMIVNPRPTRAEISDIANAVEDGSSAIMLSGETSAGKHPVLSVETMAKIALEKENNMEYGAAIDFARSNNESASTAYAAAELARSIDAAAIIVDEKSGINVRDVSRFRPKGLIFAVAKSEQKYHQMALYFGVYPHLLKGKESASSEALKKEAQKAYGLKAGDKVVLVLAPLKLGENATIVASVI